MGKAVGAVGEVLSNGEVSDAGNFGAEGAKCSEVMIDASLWGVSVEFDPNHVLNGHVRLSLSG